MTYVAAQMEELYDLEAESLDAMKSVLPHLYSIPYYLTALSPFPPTPVILHMHSRFLSIHNLGCDIPLFLLPDVVHTPICCRVMLLKDDIGYT